MYHNILPKVRVILVNAALAAKVDAIKNRSTLNIGA